MKERIDDLPLDHPALALFHISAALRRVLGGTSGPLYAIFVLRAATSLAEADDPASGRAWAMAFRAGCDGIASLGGGKAGDRTMLDALFPAADAIDAAVAGKRDGGAIAAAAAEAAKAGVEATRSMVPKLGRSTYLGDRTQGHPDPGAYAVAVWLQAIASTFPPS